MTITLAVAEKMQHVGVDGYPTSSAIRTKAAHVVIAYECVRKSREHLEIDERLLEKNLQELALLLRNI